MNTGSEKSSPNGDEISSTSEEQLKKINEVRRLLGPLPVKQSMYCSDASISRYLLARNWHVKKAAKKLKQTLKWRSEYKPEEIRWEDIAHEAETGKVYRSNFVDKRGRTVLVLRPSFQVLIFLVPLHAEQYVNHNCLILVVGIQNTKSTKGQIKYLVYCIENAIMNLPPDQEQMVWLIDFNNFNLAHVSLTVTKETAHVLQEHYPERLGVGIFFNPPKIFEQFWTVVKPFLEPRTRKKPEFVYHDDANSMKIMEELFDMNSLDCAFGGKNSEGFDIVQYADSMKEDDKTMLKFWAGANGIGGGG